LEADLAGVAGLQGAARDEAAVVDGEDDGVKKVFVGLVKGAVDEHATFNPLLATMAD
jgi:hypothetical protein